MSKPITSPFFQQERKTEMATSAANSWNNTTFGSGGGGWSFPGSVTSSMNPSSAGQLIQPSINLPTQPSSSPISTSNQTIPPSIYPPIVLMSPTWNIPNPANSPGKCHLSFANDTENLHITVTSKSGGSITTHLVGKGTKFSFSAPTDQDLTISVATKTDDSVGIIAQVDNDPFCLRSKR